MGALGCGGQRQALLGLAREVKPNRQPRWLFAGAGIGQFQSGAVLASDRRNKAEPQPAARGGTAGIEPHEALKHMLALLGRDPKAEIGYRNRRRDSARHLHRDALTLRTVFDCVVDEIGDGLEQQLAVALGGGGTVEVQIEVAS